MRKIQKGGMTSMNSYQIDYFLCAAKHLSFTKAAEELYTSQPTISRQVALLEEELGITLFIREKNIVRLTAGGAIMLQEFKKIKKGLIAAAESVARISKGLEGKISIGYISNLNTDIFVYPPLSEFSKLYPSIDIKIESATFSILREKLNAGNYDIIYTYSFELAALENIFHEYVYEVSSMFIMSKSHPLAAKIEYEPSDFKGQTFLLPDPEESSGRIAEMLSICNSLGIKDIVIRSTNNIESMLFGIRCGQGLGILSSGMDCVFDNRYHCIQIPKINYDIHIATVWNVNNLNPLIPLYMSTFSKYKKTIPILPSGAVCHLTKHKEQFI
jgi:DNA-binding transcriptional LysR family regulator